LGSGAPRGAFLKNALRVPANLGGGAPHGAFPKNALRVPARLGRRRTSRRFPKKCPARAGPTWEAARLAALS